MLEGAAGVWARHFPGITDTIAVNAELSTTPPSPVTLGLVEFGGSVSGPHVLKMFVRDSRFWWVAVHEMGHAFGYGHPVSRCGPAVAAIWTGACPLVNSHSVFSGEVMSAMTVEHPTLNPLSIAVIAGTSPPRPASCTVRTLSCAFRHARVVLATVQLQL